MDQPIAISFFTGIGGIDIAAQYAGFRVLVMVEIDPFCQEVLKARFPDATLFGDIREVTGEKIRQAMIERGHFPHGYVGPLASLVLGGPPCQAASLAGKRGGTADERWLWPEYFRLVREINPRWVLAENVSGLLSLGADDISGGEFGVLLWELAQMGFRVGWGLYGADDVGAPHERHRVFLVAHSFAQRLQAERTSGDRDDDALPGRPKHTGYVQTSAVAGGIVADTDQQLQHRCGITGPGWRAESADGRGELADAAGDGPQGRRKPGWQGERRQGTDCGGRRPSEPGIADKLANAEGVGRQGDRADGEQVAGVPIGEGLSGRNGSGSGTGDRPTKPGLGRAVYDELPSWLDGSRWAAGPGEAQHNYEPPRVASGVPNRVARLKALGNAVVPAQVFPLVVAIYRQIMQEDGTTA